MAKLFLTPINLNQNQLQNAVIQPLSSAPGSPVTGQVYFDTTLGYALFWSGTAWVNVATNALLLNAQAGSYYLSRANHTGTQLAATISNLATTVQAYTLNQFAAAAANISMGGFLINNVGTPLVSTDAVNKAYVDATAQGLSQKPSANCATTAALPSNTYANGTAGVGATLTATANGVLTIDGYTVALNDVVLVKNEATQANNGLYTVTTLGTGAVPYVLTRSVDMNSATLFGGGFIAVKQGGTVNANTLWLCDVANSITVGTTAVAFVQLNSATTYTQGNGISISANVVSAVANTGIIVNGSGIGVDFTKVPGKYVIAFGDGAATSYTITHNLGTQDVMVTVYSATTPWAEVECDVQHSTTNTVTLLFSVAPTTNQYRCVVHG